MLGAAPVLLVLVQRPDGPSPDWLRRDEVETLTLEPLTRAQSALLIEQSSAAISSDNVREILTRADGIPLFVQELTRLVASGTGRTEQAGPLCRIACAICSRLGWIVSATRSALNYGRRQ